MTSTPSVANPGAGFALGDYEHTGIDGIMAASPNGNGQLVYVRNPSLSGAAATGVVFGSGWQFINRIIP